MSERNYRRQTEYHHTNTGRYKPRRRESAIARINRVIPNGVTQPDPLEAWRQVRKLPLSDHELWLDTSMIRVNGGTQSRAEINPFKVDEYTDWMRQGVDFPAIMVFFDGQDYWLADGFHRWHAVKQAGIPEIKCEVRQGTRRDAVLYSVGANWTHGLGRNNADKRRAVMMLLSDPEWSNWSNVVIARHCRVDEKTVRNIRKEIVTSENPKLVPNPAPLERTFVTRHGTPATMKVSSIGQESVRQKVIHQRAPEPIKERLQENEIGVETAYRLTLALENLPVTDRETIAGMVGDNVEKIQILNRLYEGSHRSTSSDTYAEVIAAGGFSYNHQGKSMWLDWQRAPVEKIKFALEQKAREHRQMIIDARRAEAFSTPLPIGKYRCIVIDPPYPVEKIEREVRPNQTRDLDYPTMTLDEIAALPVRDLAVEAGTHLYLWTTHKYLPAALDLMRGWGFTYQCMFTWVKPTGMTPYSWMYNTELVLFGHLGDLPLTALGLKLHFEAPVIGHSIKPDVFYTDRVIPASPGPRIEMFARKQREGFHVWGNEVQQCAAM
jgi:N6-adenosine-specific RNA methylase IME4